ncbi:ParB/RepB/Spo0J family partition protein [Cohnella caldifontis]|uniref:ParB/RepB/Spo0J family partition protein n=1 Tax=Cohnella caldifontis TaxID=3027471 RepID=UPI0023ED4583|nr:ParB/RepB/Spo0J family partition protein [Cohnella sp. YIM B05605]
MEMVELPLDLIDEDTDQPRYQFDDEAIQELMNSISEIGLLSPIKVRTLPNGRYKIIYGNRRYKASKNLGRATIPCIVSNVTDELEIYLEQVAENLTREGFSPIEEAEAFHKLMNDPKFTSSVKFLSSKLGKTEHYIKNKLELLKFDAKVKKLIVSGSEIRKDKLTEEQLLPIKDLPMEHRDSLALLIARDELPVSDVKKLAKLFKDPDISAATKDKLLYKSGYELLQTWSTLEANRKERAKLAEAKAAKEAEEAEARAMRQAAADEDESSDTGSDSPARKSNPLEAKLQKLLGALSPDTSLPPEAPVSLAHEDRQRMLGDIQSLIGQLERHLAAWQSLKDRIASNE